MPTKKELSDMINELLPSEGGMVDFTSMPKKDLEALHGKLEHMMESLLEGGEGIVDDILSKRFANRMGNKLDLNGDEREGVRKVIKDRFENGPFFKRAKKFLKKRMLDGN